MRVVILHDEVAPDARPDELDTLVQVDCVSRALKELGHEPLTMGCSLNLDRIAQRLGDWRPDCVFNLVESVRGQGRLIHLAPSLLDSLGLPYTGAGTEAMFVTSSKTLCKQVLSAAGIDTPGWFTPQSLSAYPGPVTGRFIIKPAWEEASVGIEDEAVADFNNREELRSALGRAGQRLGVAAFAECYVEGREFNISILSESQDGSLPQVLPPAEIQFLGYAPGKPRIVGYSAKWRQDSHEFNNTPRTFDFDDEDRSLLAELIRMAERCWRVLGLRGYARVDFRVDAQGRPWALEVNANPCISPDAGFVAAAQRAGMSLVDVVERLLRVATRGAQS